VPLERVRVEGLRCLDGVDCRLHPSRNYLFGPNGAGKTSFLEAVYLLGRGRSFRTRQTRRLVRHGREELSVYAELRRDEDVRRLGVRFASGDLEFRVDRLSVAGVTDIARLLRVDVIDPSVHNLIEGGPSERRRFLDWGVFHVEPDYLPTWRRYRRALGQRNAALKQGARGAAAAAWDQALIEAAEKVDAARNRYVARLGPLAAAAGQALLERRIGVIYRPGWRSGLTFREALGESAARDSAAGFTQVGPHRADLRIELGEAAVADEASRGQQKLAAAALVIAQVKEREADRDAILLVDDPAAELDQGALRRLLAELEALRCQQIYTGLSPRSLPRGPEYPVFHVEQGHIKECYNESV
jgi:DNA replication and repair protein RecF